MALAWAGMAEIVLAGDGYFLLISPTAAANAAYGRNWSIAALALAFLITFAAAAVVLSATSVRRWAAWVLALLLAGATGVIAPFALAELLAKSSDGYVMVLAVVGMIVLATHLARPFGPLRLRRERP